MAAAIVRVIRLLFDWGRRHNFPNVNPAAKPKITYRAPKQLIWPVEAIDHFVATADAMGLHSIGTAVLLNEWIGQRQEDVITIDLNQFRDEWLYIDQSKIEDAEVWLPIGDVPRLANRIAEERERRAKRKLQDIQVTSLLICERTNTPWNIHSFRTKFAEIRRVAADGSNELDIPPMEDMEKYKFAALRHTAITRLANEGVEIIDIAAVTGHSIEHCKAIIDRYLTRTKKMAKRAFRIRRDAEGG